jgi:hypothetical protein
VGNLSLRLKLCFLLWATRNTAFKHNPQVQSNWILTV